MKKFIVAALMLAVFVPVLVKADIQSELQAQIKVLQLQIQILQLQLRLAQLSGGSVVQAQPVDTTGVAPALPSNTPHPAYVSGVSPLVPTKTYDDGMGLKISYPVDLKAIAQIHRSPGEEMRGEPGSPSGVVLSLPNDSDPKNVIKIDQRMISPLACSIVSGDGATKCILWDTGKRCGMFVKYTFSSNAQILADFDNIQLICSAQNP